jgi:hypothetical protein
MDVSLNAGSAAGGFTPAASSFNPSFNPTDFSLNAGAQFSGQGLNPATAGYGLQVPDPGFGAYAPSSAGLNVTSLNPVTNGTQVTNAAGTLQSATPLSQYVGGSYVGPSGSASGGTLQTGGTGAKAGPEDPSMFDKIKQVPGKIADKLTDPERLADLTLRAAGMLAGSAVAGDGLSDEERALVEQQRADLENLRNTNRSLFDQRLEQAQNLMGESKYFDPEYFGLQRARRAQLAGAKAKRAGLRGLEGGARRSEGRRFDLATARDTGTAYDVGYGTGVQGRLGTMQAGMTAMPSAYPSAAAEYTALQNVYTNANTRARDRQKDIGNLFGSLTGG